MSIQEARERPRGTLRLSPAKPRQPSNGSKPAVNPQAQVQAMTPKDLSVLDAPRFFDVAVKPGEAPRSISIKPSAVEALFPVNAGNKWKTVCVFHNGEKKSRRTEHPKPILLDVHYAIISFWWHSSFPNAAKTPQDQKRLEYEAYCALKMKYEGEFPKLGSV